MENNNLNEMLEQVDNFMTVPRKGNIVKGKVVQVSDEEVVVNIGYKSDGIIPLNEISSDSNFNFKEVIKEGDEIDVYVLKGDDGEGNVILSKKRVDSIKDWEVLESKSKDNEILEVRTGEVVKGGIIAYYNEIRGFIPASQLDVKYVENIEEYANKTLEVEVIEVNKDKNKAVFSHKKVLEERLKAKKEELWNRIEKDQVVEGEVKKLANFGAFVDLGGVDGLIHISEISWNRIKHPSEVLKVGDKVEVYIKEIDKEKEKISLSLKQTKGNPWDDIDEKYSIGEIVDGKVVKLMGFGAFVEIEAGVEGLVHISQISEKHISKPADELEVGQSIKVKIINISKEDKKISLSIKEANETKEEYDSEYILNDEEEPKVTIGDIINSKKQN